jgi:hypothetical protein
MVTMTTLVDRRVGFEVAEGDTYSVPIERAISLASYGRGTPDPPPEWWPEELLVHAATEAREVARVRSTATKGRPLGLPRPPGPDDADDAWPAGALPWLCVEWLLPRRRTPGRSASRGECSRE